MGANGFDTMLHQLRNMQTDPGEFNSLKASRSPEAQHFVPEQLLLVIPAMAPARDTFDCFFVWNKHVD